MKKCDIMLKLLQNIHNSGANKYEYGQHRKLGNKEICHKVDVSHFLQILWK